MKACRHGIRLLLLFTIAALVFCPRGFAQTCFTSDDMDPATRSALQAAASKYFDMVARGDTASLRQNSIPAVASNFGAIENTIKENQSNLAAATPIFAPRLS